MYQSYVQLKESLRLWMGQFAFAAGTEWLTALLVLVLCFLILRALRWIVITVTSWLEKPDKKDAFDVIGSFVAYLDYPFAILVSLYVASLFLPLSAGIEQAINAVFIFVIVIYVVLAARRQIMDAFKVAMRFGRRGNAEADRTAGVFFRVVVEAILWILAAIIILQSWGYNVSVLLGGLGVAGLVVSLSFQNVLKDVFAFFSIYSDRTFKVGDYIETEEVSGEVAEITLRTTRVKAVSGQDIIVSNRKLTDGVVQNFGRIQKRRMKMEVTVTINTAAQKLKKLSGVLTEAIAQWREQVKSEAEATNDKEEFELIRVYLKKVTQDGFIFEIDYRVNVGDYAIYLDYREKINLLVVETIRQAGVELAGQDIRVITD